MLVERGLRITGIDRIGKAYGIASSYLRRSGALPETGEPDERLLEVVVRLAHRGETNQLLLANRAIRQFLQDHG